MRIEFGEFLSRILVKARKQYRFAGVVIGRVGIGILWASKKEPPVEIKNQPALPGIGG